jgi:hypothetical protein
MQSSGYIAPISLSCHVSDDVRSSNYVVINEKLTGKDMEGSSGVLIWSTILAIVWRDWRKQQNSLSHDSHSQCQGWNYEVASTKKEHLYNSKLNTINNIDCALTPVWNLVEIFRVWEIKHADGQKGGYGLPIMQTT